MNIPEGWRLVPEDPTESQQFNAAFNLCNQFGNEFVRSHKSFAMAVYTAMLAAAPNPADHSEDVRGMVDALHSMTCAYRSAISAGHDRITALGGDCDSVQMMLNGYPDYKNACDLVAAYRANATSTKGAE